LQRPCLTASTASHLGNFWPAAWMAADGFQRGEELLEKWLLSHRTENLEQEESPSRSYSSSSSNNESFGGRVCSDRSSSSRFDKSSFSREHRQTRVCRTPLEKIVQHRQKCTQPPCTSRGSPSRGRISSGSDRKKVRRTATKTAAAHRSRGRVVRARSRTPPPRRTSSSSSHSSRGPAPPPSPSPSPSPPPSPSKATSEVIHSGTDSTEVPGNLDVASIGGRADWYVDAVELRLRNGAVHIYGGNGGNAKPLEELDTGEVIVAVEQRNLQVGHLGSALLFHLSSGRTITVSGHYGNKKCKQKKKI